ncbi:hypothetical protein Tco_0862237 [Tanacetum coccineum]
MGDANPIRTLEDYSRPSHEGYRNTIELPEGNNMVPLRSDTIRLVQNECSFHGLRFEDPNKHLKDFLKLVNSLDLDVANRERTHLRFTCASASGGSNNDDNKRILIDLYDYEKKEDEESSKPKKQLVEVKSREGYSWEECIIFREVSSTTGSAFGVSNCPFGSTTPAFGTSPTPLLARLSDNPLKRLSEDARKKVQISASQEATQWPSRTN